MKFETPEMKEGIQKFGYKYIYYVIRFNVQFFWYCIKSTIKYSK